MPLGSVDGCHVNCHSYNGTLYELVMLSQQKKVIPIAMALFPKETIDNIQWFLTLCIKSGIELNKLIIFSDRGKALPAVNNIAKEGYAINIKFCTDHIIKNVISNFASLGKQRESVSKQIYLIQQSTNIGHYNDNVFEFGRLFGYAAAKYVANIHPRHWVVFCNDLSYNDSRLSV